MEDQKFIADLYAAITEAWRKNEFATIAEFINTYLMMQAPNQSEQLNNRNSIKLLQQLYLFMMQDPDIFSKEKRSVFLILLNAIQTSPIKFVWQDHNGNHDDELRLNLSTLLTRMQAHPKLFYKIPRFIKNLQEKNHYYYPRQKNKI